MAVVAFIVNATLRVKWKIARWIGSLVDCNCNGRLLPVDKTSDPYLLLYKWTQSSEASQSSCCCWPVANIVAEFNMESFITLSLYLSAALLSLRSKNVTEWESDKLTSLAHSFSWNNQTFSWESPRSKSRETFLVLHICTLKISKKAIEFPHR